MLRHMVTVSHLRVVSAADLPICVEVTGPILGAKGSLKGSMLLSRL